MSTAPAVSSTNSQYFLKLPPDNFQDCASINALFEPSDAQSATTVETKNYLDRCVEQLDPSVASSREWCAFWYRVAATATAVAFTALAVGVFVATGVFAPVYIPIAAIGAFAASQIVLEFCKKLFTTADLINERADKLKKIKFTYDSLASATQGQLVAKLNGFGDGLGEFAQDNPDSLTAAKALIARYDFWRERSVACEKLEADFLNDATRLSKDNYYSHRFPINQFREDAITLHRQSLINKVRSAFVLTMLQSPQTKGMLESFGDFAPITPLEQLLGKYAEDDKVDELFIFKNKRVIPITIKDAETKSSFDLSKHLLAAVSA